MFLMEVLRMESITEVTSMGRNRRKIAVIGAGNVGATCAFVLAQMKIADIAVSYTHLTLPTIYSV